MTSKNTTPAPNPRVLYGVPSIVLTTFAIVGSIVAATVDSAPEDLGKYAILAAAINLVNAALWIKAKRKTSSADRGRRS